MGGLHHATAFIWDEAKLNRFIVNPDEMVPGNNMKPYGDLASGNDRAKGNCFFAIAYDR
jgi:cytochrome c